MLWLLIGTRLRLLTVELLSTIEPLCPSRCLFGMIMVALYLIVWDWLVLRAEPMLSGWPNLLFLFVSYNFLFFFLLWVGCVWMGLPIDSVLNLSRRGTADSILKIIIIKLKISMEQQAKLTLEVGMSSVPQEAVLGPTPSPNKYL